MDGPGLNSQLYSLKRLGIRKLPKAANQVTTRGKRSGDHSVTHLQCMVVLVLFPQPSHQWVTVQTCWDHNGVDMKGAFISPVETAGLAV